MNVQTKCVQCGFAGTDEDFGEWQNDIGHIELVCPNCGAHDVEQELP